MKRILAVFILLTVAAATSSVSATPVSGQLSVTGSLLLYQNAVDFHPAGGGVGALTVTAIGQSGTFATMPGTAGTAKDTLWVGASFPLSNFIVLAADPTLNFTLTRFDMGLYPPASCSDPAAAGQVCTPAYFAYNVQNYVNLSSQSSTLTLVGRGTVTNALAETSKFVGTFTVQFPSRSFQSVEALLHAAGAVQTTFSAVIDVEAPVVVAPQTELSLTKTNATTSVTPGGPTSWTVVVTNAGPDTAVAASVSDPFPAAVTSPAWTCTASPGSACAIPGGTGDIVTTVTLLSGGTATFLVNATVAPSATGSVVNTATVTAPAGSVDNNPADNSATDTDTIVPAQADLSVTKTNGTTNVSAGTNTAWTIVVTNSGAGTVTNAQVTDTLPPQISSASWTCTPSAGSSCAANAGTGNISTTVTLLSGGTATFVINASIALTATGTLSNTATVTAPAGVVDPAAGNNAATDADAISAVSPTTVPTLGGFGTAAMMLLLAMAAFAAIRMHAG